LSTDKEPKRYRNTLIFPAALDPDAVKIIRRLKRFNHTAYMVGGCVRDLLLGSIPKDFDISTSARPRQIRRLFKNSKVIGRRFKLAHIIFGAKIIEVSTFRKAPPPDSSSSKRDGLLITRDNVYGSERDDALRRDFTINSLFYDIHNEEVVDYSGGVDDVNKRLLKSIGDPKIRFQEDPVRTLRAIRFSCRLNLEIDPSTFKSMELYAKDISLSAPQRVTEEIIRLLSCGAASSAIEQVFKLGLFEILFPEVNQIINNRSPFFSDNQTAFQLLINSLKALDEIDRGERLFGNPVYLAPILSHLGGNAIHEAKMNSDIPVDPGSILNLVLRPIAIRMGLSRRDLSILKHIIIAYPKLCYSNKRRRLKPRDLVRRDYFPDALEFFRQISVATSGDLRQYEWWKSRVPKQKSKAVESSGKRKRK